MLIREGAGSMQAESSKLKAIKGIIAFLYFQHSALSFQPKLRRTEHPINENVQEKIAKL